MIHIFKSDEDEAVYRTGFLDYAVSSLDGATAFHKYAAWLEDQPVANFLNTEDWTVDEKLTEATYKAATEDEEVLPITLVLLFHPSSDSNELILHSLQSTSFFFLVNEDYTLDALYVD